MQISFPTNPSAQPGQVFEPLVGAYSGGAARSTTTLLLAFPRKSFVSYKSRFLVVKFAVTTTGTRQSHLEKAY